MLDEITLWRIPAALVMGVLVQLFYLPSTSKGRLDGVIGIVFMCLGTCMAYWWKWR